MGASLSSFIGYGFQIGGDDYEGPPLANVPDNSDASGWEEADPACRYPADGWLDATKRLRERHPVVVKFSGVGDYLDEWVFVLESYLESHDTPGQLAVPHIDVAKWDQILCDWCEFVGRPMGEPKMVFGARYF